MTDDILIEWSLEETEIKSPEVPECCITQLATMTLDEEIREILIPLNHPIGAASIQVIGLGTTYEYVIYYSQQNKQIVDESSIGQAFFSLLTVFAIFTFICWKYCRARHLSWISISLLAISAWIIVEWSLFLD